jgi:putative membrane protein
MSLRHKIFTLGVAAVAALPAGPATAAPAEPATTHHAIAVVRPASPEAEFLVAVHQGNLAQIAAGKLAARKSGNRVIRKLGKRFAAYHKKLDAQVKRAALTLEVNLPTEPNSEQKDLAGQYRAAGPDEFDALFISTQLSGYERAAKLARVILQISTDPAIREIVESAGPRIEENRLALTSARDQLSREQSRQ